MKKIALGIWVSLTLCCGTAFSQFNYHSQYHYPEFNDSLANCLLLRIEDNNFFKNNEYFGNLAEGYTLLGYDVEPSLMYYAGSKVRLKVGAHFKKFSGKENFSNVVPILSVHAKLAPHLDMVMGSLRSTIHHQVSEPLLDTELQITRPIENGLQFLVNSNRHWADIWIDWQNYIVHNDLEPEKLLFGYSSRHKCLNPTSNWDLTIPLSALIRHSGGQITLYKQTIQTQMNGSVGCELKKSWKQGFMKNVTLRHDYLVYRDLAQNSGLPFFSGHANYTTLNLETGNLQLMAGHFIGHDFLAKDGNPLFQSLSNYLPDYYRKTPQILTLKVNYGYTLTKGVKFNAIFESYHDYVQGQFEYSYGLNLMFVPDWFLLKAPLS